MGRSSKDDANSKWKIYTQRGVEQYRGPEPSQRASLCKLLKQARLDNKLTQRQAGELLGQDQMFISKIESGKRQVGFIEMERFAQIYGKKLSFFSTLRRIH